MHSINANHRMINESFWLDSEGHKCNSEVKGTHMFPIKLRFGQSVFLRCRPARIPSVEAARTASWSKTQTNGCLAYHFSNVFLHVFPPCHANIICCQGPTLIPCHAFATFGIQLTRSPEVMPDDRIVAAWNLCD